MNDIGKSFRNWQKQDINKLKNIREKHEKENKIIGNIVLIGIVIFITYLLFNTR